MSGGMSAKRAENINGQGNGSAAEDPLGPSNCASRNRAEDAADAVKDMAAMISGMDPELVRKLVTARDAAVGIHKAFPEGDQRFVDSDSETDDGFENVKECETADFAIADDDNAEGETCYGLLDRRTDPGPLAALQRAKEEYDFDLVQEMDNMGLEIFERIRVTNYIRKLVRDGTESHETIRQFRRVLNTKDNAVFDNDALLEPIIEGDLILTVLEHEQLEEEENSDIQEITDAVQRSLEASDVLR